MADAKRLRQLCGNTLFADLEEAELERIASLMTDFEAPSGRILMRGGDTGAGMLLIEDGSVLVSLPNREVELGAGECVGELALLDDRGKHVARVRAATDVRGYAIDRDHFVEMLEAEPRVALALLRILARRLADSVAT